MMTSQKSDAQFDWLVAHGHAALAGLKISSTRPVRVDWSAARFSDWQRALLEQQLHYRERSASRFPDPNKWLWTDRSLQQASDWQSAVTKATFFPSSARAIDACCGAGADLVALAERHEVVAIDRDPAMLQLAKSNLHAHGLEAEFLKAELPSALRELSGWSLHIDPDRRRGQARETRTTHTEAFSPPLADILSLGEQADACIIKLAPASEVELAEPRDWRRAWLGVGRECPQQLLMRGKLSWIIPEQQRGALLVEHSDQPYVGRTDVQCYSADEPEEFVYEPAAALYASGLAAAWADEQGLSALPHAGSYFTGQAIPETPWTQAFEVAAHMSWDERRVRKWLRSNKAGTVEVKTRNVPLDANQLQRQLSQAEGEPITCLLYRTGKSIRAIMARRKVV